jgi:hypothetical protein
MEDRELMRTRGEVRRSLVFVDSAARDEGEEANEYTVHLDVHFKNVVSVNVIDASVPATEYIVEPHSNTFRVFASGHEPRPEAVTAFAAEYVAWFLQMVPDPAWRDEGSDAAAEVVVRDFRAGPPVQVEGMPPVSSGAPYALSVLPEGGSPPPGSVVWEVVDATGMALTLALHSDDGTGAAPMPVYKRVYRLGIGNFAQMTRFVANIESGDGTARSAVLTPRGFPFLVPASDNVEQLGKMAIDADQWALDFDLPACVLLFDTTSTAAMTLGFQRPVSAMRVWGRQMSTNMVGGEPVNLFVGTSLMSLTGASYITLRCSQIESSAYVGASQSAARGMGIMKLGNPGVIRSEKVDYISSLPHEFPPIPKLTRLSLRFERGGTGLLYDFKGIDHIVIFAIGHIEPKALPCTDIYPLNPEYNPDFHTYVGDRLAATAEEDALERDTRALDEARMSRALQGHAQGVVNLRNAWDFS